MNCLELVRSSGPGVIVYKSRAIHRVLSTCNMSCATWYEGTAQLSCLTGLKWHLCYLFVFWWFFGGFLGGWGGVVGGGGGLVAETITRCCLYIKQPAKRSVVLLWSYVSACPGAVPQIHRHVAGTFSSQPTIAYCDRVTCLLVQTASVRAKRFREHNRWCDLCPPAVVSEM